MLGEFPAIMGVGGITYKEATTDRRTLTRVTVSPLKFLRRIEHSSLKRMRNSQWYCWCTGPAGPHRVLARGPS
jgi:hypothetical protein